METNPDKNTSIKNNVFVKKGYIQLLVIECQSNLRWDKIFQDDVIETTEGPVKIKIEQGEWDDISLVSYGDGAGCVVSFRPNRKNNFETKTFQVDFILLRSVTRGIHHQDSRNLLYGFIHANIPSVNSLHSAVMALERPLFFSALKQVQKKLGKKNFPLIEQSYYPSHNSIIVTPEFPLVSKVGHAHAGYGKVKLKSSEEMADFKSLMALYGDYITMEPFIEWDFDMRIQKIGNHYRGFRRTSMNWKGNTGNSSVIEKMEVTDEYKLWIDECAKAFGGLDICALDLLHSKKDDKDYILELNDTAIGLVHEHEQEDMTFMKDVVILRMKQQLLSDVTGQVDVPVSVDGRSEVELLKEELQLAKIQIEREQKEKKEIQDKLAKLEDAMSKKKKFGIF